jgi:hypothetical protein
MASIIAGHGHDAGLDGVSGIAPEAKILSIRVIPDKNDPGNRQYNSQTEQAVQDELANGIKTAVKDGAQVISMSIGYNAPSGAVRDAVNDAYAHGVVLVASSGNSGSNDAMHGSNNPDIAPVSYPAEYPGVLSVGAVTATGVAASFSSGNLSVRISAPGQDVVAQGNTGGYFQVSGTSPACALVAGVAALIKSRYPKISPAQVDEALISTAQQHQPGSGSGYSVLTGFGVIDAGAAMGKAGQLMGQSAQKSQVASAAHFGGGAAAAPAPPVAPRGGGTLTASAVLALLAALIVLGGGYLLYRARSPRAAAGYPAYPQPAYPQQGFPGQSSPGSGYPGQGFPGQGFPESGYPGQGSPGQGSPGQGSPGQGSPGQGSPGQGSPGQASPESGFPDSGGPRFQ